MKNKFFRPQELKPELLNAFKGYKAKFILNDLFAGLMVALVALPLNLAMGYRQTPEGFNYALQIGLWTAIVGGVLLSIFGGTKFSVGGPTAPFIAIIVILIGSFSTNDNFIAMQGVFFTVALAGVILIVAGLLKAGKLLKFISYPALIGICLGIGVALLFNLVSDLGLTLAPHTDLTRSMDTFSPFISRLIRTGAGITQFSVSSFIIGGFAVALVYLLPKIPKVGKKLPSMIIAIAAATGLSLLLRIAETPHLQPITIGSHFGELDPAWNWHYLQWSQLRAIIATPTIYLFAFAIAIVAMLEGMTSATAVENISGIKFNKNQEIIGHGIANLGSGILGGLPITAAMARTNLNYESGAKSNLAGIFQAIFLLLFYVLLLQFMGVIPLAALTAPLVKVAISTSFYPVVVKLLRFTKRDTSILIVTGLVTIIFGVHFGVIAGVGLSFLVNIKSFKDKLVITETDVKEVPNFICPETETETTIKALKIQGTVFFANAHKVIKKIAAEIENADKLVLDLSATNSVDATVAERLAKLTKALTRNNKELILLNANDRIDNLYSKANNMLYPVKKAVKT